MSDHVCGQCRFWEYIRIGEFDRGLCRRHAPRPAAGLIGAAPYVGGGLPSVWPETLIAEFCGEWEAKQ